MLLRVIHDTRYDYAPAARNAQHVAHLRPADGGGQRVLRHALGIDPQPARLAHSRDVWGNTRSFFELAAAHEGLLVRADSVVRTAPAAPLATDSLPWEAARERLRYHRQARWDAAAEFAFASPYVPRHEDFAAYARPSFAPGRPLLEAARDLMGRIHREFAYVAQATDASTPALQALALRKGVCQDFAHVMLGCLRSLGLPARYVSGYLLTQPAPGQPRLVGSDASHAWVAVYLPPAGNGDGDGDGESDGDGAARGVWAGLDPTNDRAPGEDYVVLATGRDFGDVSPLRGVIHGGARHTLQVGVTVQPLTPAEADALAAEPTIDAVPG